MGTRWRDLSGKPVAAFEPQRAPVRECLLHFRRVRERERIFDLDAQVAKGGLNLRMTEQDMHSPEVTGLLVNQGCLCSP